jgi:hypothetical protein
MSVKSLNYPVAYDKEKVRIVKLTLNKDILHLFKIVFDREYKEDLLEWFAAAPSGPNKWYAAFENGEPAGMYGLLPTKIRIGRNIYGGALCNNVGVIPRFFGKGLFQSLGEFALKDSDFPVVVCLPNIQAVRGHKLVGWEGYGTLELLSAEMGERKVDFVGYPQFKYIPPKVEKYFQIVKDEAFLRWRYSKPNEEYFQTVIGSDDYIIWKSYQGKKQVMEISDYNYVFKLNGAVDILQFEGSRASQQLKNGGFVSIFSNEFLLYTKMSIERDVDLFNFEPGDNDVF